MISFLSSTGDSEPDIPNGFPEVIIDSGGFQLQTGVYKASSDDSIAKLYPNGIQYGKYYFVERYALWLEQMLPRHPEVVAYMNFDVLDDPDLSLEYLNQLEKHGLHPLPIWHDGDDMSYLSYYCQNYPWVAIGGMVSTGGLGKGYLSRLTTMLTQKYPETKFHLLGIGLSGAIGFKASRPYSVDFSTWSSVMRFGHEIILDKKQFIKEVQMDQASRDRLRTDKDFQELKVREAIMNIKEFERLVNLSYEPPQGLLF